MLEPLIEVVHENPEAGDVKSPDDPDVAVPVPNVTVTLTDDGTEEDCKATHNDLLPPSSATPVMGVDVSPGETILRVIVPDCPTTETGAAGNNPTTNAANKPNASTRFTMSPPIPIRRSPARKRT